MTPKSQIREVMTTEQLCEFLSVSPNWVYEAVGRYEIPHSRLPSRTGRGDVRFVASEVLEWLKKTRGIMTPEDERALLDGRRKAA